MHNGSDRCILAPYLTDTTALPLDSSLFTVLVNLIREECVKDLVDQFGGGGFSGTLEVLLNLCGMTYGLSSGRSPENQKQTKMHFMPQRHRADEQPR